jgi:hypothetical protein
MHCLKMYVNYGTLSIERDVGDLGGFSLDVDVGLYMYCKNGPQNYIEATAHLAIR